MQKKKIAFVIALSVLMNFGAHVFAEDVIGTADLFIENKSVSGGYFYFEIHITPTSDWGDGDRKGLGDCSWYFAYNIAALSNPVLTYENTTYVGGDAYSNSVGISGKGVGVTTEYDDSKDGSAIPVGQKTHMYTVRMDIDDSGANSSLQWNEIDTGIFNTRDGGVAESYYGSGDTSLPVELAAFSVACTTEGVLIEWASESETDNLGYLLERKVQGDPEWSLIASYKTHENLKCEGNTSTRTNYAFTDVNVFAGDTYIYRLSDVDTKGKVTIGETIEMLVTQDVVPEVTALLPAWPNPFNPETRIKYQLSEPVVVNLSVFDIMGRRVTTIVRAEQHRAGNYINFWNGRDDQGQVAASGVYFLVLRAGDIVRSQKVLLVR
ncbi:T9SS type A sorting domain-containing protein [bacterium]|nr:T9SS type A sorting domain-containing protein [bacterium]